MAIAEKATEQAERESKEIMAAADQKLETKNMELETDRLKTQQEALTAITSEAAVREAAEKYLLEWTKERSLKEDVQIQLAKCKTSMATGLEKYKAVEKKLISESNEVLVKSTANAKEVMRLRSQVAELEQEKADGTTSKDTTTMEQINQLGMWQTRAKVLEANLKTAEMNKKDLEAQLDNTKWLLEHSDLTVMRINQQLNWHGRCVNSYHNKGTIKAM